MSPKILAVNLTPKAADGIAEFLRTLATLIVRSLSFLNSLAVEKPSTRPSLSQSCSFPAASRSSAILREAQKERFMDEAAAPRYLCWKTRAFSSSSCSPRRAGRTELRAGGSKLMPSYNNNLIKDRKIEPKVVSEPVDIASTLCGCLQCSCKILGAFQGGGALRS